MKTYIIIGASAAGINAAGALRQQDAEANIIVLTQDAQVYARMMLHRYLSGEAAAGQISTLPADYAEKNRLDIRFNTVVSKLHPAEKSVELSTGEKLSYDGLLLATGSDAFIPPIPNFREAKNVHTLRTMEQADHILKDAANAKTCVIVGSGLVGLDAASALCQRGLTCHVLDLAPHLASLQLDATAAGKYQERFEKAGCVFHFGVKAAGGMLNACRHMHSVQLDNGENIPCDFVVVAAGVRPNFTLAQEAGIACDRGIVTDDYLATSDPSIWAAGDVTGRSGTWMNAVAQGQCAAKNMTGEPTIYTDTIGARNMMRYFDLSTGTLGINQVEETDKVVQSVNGEDYTRLVFRDGKLWHVLLQGNVSSLTSYHLGASL